jgi:DNA-binding NtrC family response regulator/Tfp pilus assembly protein PilF
MRDERKDERKAILAEKQARLRQTQDPEARLALLLELARAEFHYHKDKAKRYAASALKRAQALGRDDTAAHAANLLADALRVEGKIDLALKYCRIGLVAARKAGDLRAEADSLNDLGLISWHRGEFDPAIESFTQSLALCEQTRDEQTQARAYTNLSLLSWEKGDLSQAMEYQQRGLGIKERIGDRYGIGIAQLNLGLIYGDTGDWEKATECYYRALVELERHGDQTDIALCYNNLGEIYLRRNKLDKARSLLEAALKCASAVPSAWAQAEALGNLGEIYFRLGDVYHARDCYERDTKLSTEMDDKEELAETCRRLGELLLSAGEREEARRVVAHGLELTRITGAKKETGSLWRVMGDVECDAGHKSEAKAAFEKGLAILKQFRNSYELGKLHLDYGRAMAREGPAHPGEREAALANLTQAEEIFRNLDAPYELELVRAGVNRIALERDLVRGGLAHPGAAIPMVVGSETTLKEIFDVLRQVAPTRACVLLRGESGTGKEVIARTLHRLSDRSGKPFVAINCAAIPETLLESELFGIEKGTATGVSERKGKFEQAQGGTVFLDEVGDMSLMLQAKLLRVLQEKQFERVGGRKPVDVDIRIIAATNKDLEQAIRDGKFREDLFYRLNVVSVGLPPLRERRDDIVSLARHFLDKYTREYRRPVKGISDQAQAMLVGHSWPGNVRELENAIERAVLLARGGTITGPDLPPALPRTAEPVQDYRQAKTQAQTKAGEGEREFLLQMLTKHDWNISRTATAMNIARRHLYRLMKKHGIERS